MENARRGKTHILPFLIGLPGTPPPVPLALSDAVAAFSARRAFRARDACSSRARIFRSEALKRSLLFLRTRPRRFPAPPPAPLPAPLPALLPALLPTPPAAPPTPGKRCCCCCCSCSWVGGERGRVVRVWEERRRGGAARDASYAASTMRCIFSTHVSTLRCCCRCASEVTTRSPALVTVTLSPPLLPLPPPPPPPPPPPLSKTDFVTSSSHDVDAMWMRHSALLDVVLTCCPPGPDERENRSWSCFRVRRGGGIRGGGARGGGGGRSGDTAARDREGGQEEEVEEGGSLGGGGVKDDDLLRERAAVVWVWASGERTSADVRRGRP